jgi:enoyl-CoA hydratase/carnithine racemase
VAGSGEVLLEVDGGVAIVTLNAPDRRNALTPAMADELIATFDEVDAKPEVGSLVIRAVGKSFCAGGDIATLTSAGKDPAAPEAYEGMGMIYESFYRLGQVKVPTVAAAAMALFGEEINGDKAVELGLTWESMDDAAVEDRAMELAGQVAADPELARVAVGNFRKEVVNGAIPWDVAMQSERPAQMWSMRRTG